jgi:hypothetical protein
LPAEEFCFAKFFPRQETLLTEEISLREISYHRKKILLQTRKGYSARMPFFVLLAQTFSEKLEKSEINLQNAVYKIGVL